MSSEIARIRLLFERGKFKEAEALARQEIAKEPQDAFLHLDLAQILVRLDRPKEAEAFARTAIGLEPDQGVPHEVLAQVMLHSSNWKGAEDAVREAMALDGDDADRRAILARVALERSKYDACLEHSEAGLTTEPDHDACRFFRGIALGRLGRHAEADEESLGLLSDDPEDSTNHSARGWVLLERNQIADAKMHFQEALRIDPENEDAQEGLAHSIQRGNPFLGWLLRTIVAIERIPAMKLLLWVVLLGIVLPRFLQGEQMPDALRIVGKTIRSAMMSFFAVALAVHPLFGALLFVSREGRLALSERQAKAVRWSLLPLLAGLVFLGLWLFRGARSTPVAAISLLCTAAWIFRGLSHRHPWVSRRLLIIAGFVGVCSLWFIFGPLWMMKPYLEQVLAAAEAIKSGQDPAAKQALVGRLAEMFRVMNWTVVYPGLGIYLATAWGGNIAEALARRAPDEGE
jgi:tetratricopeptide (TPR) repeat protein